MDWIANTLDEFGRHLGIDALRLNDQGAVRLELASGMALTLEPQVRHGNQEVLVCIGYPVGHQAGARAQAALRLAHADCFPPVDLQLALAGYGAETLLIATTRLSSRTFTVQALSGAIAALQRWLEGVMAEGDGRG